ncbi:MAG TPA: TIM-barrel domain-containing protein [bacterium]|nr:TIM-barrel domain-containing protein [bacterium]
MSRAMGKAAAVRAAMCVIAAAVVLAAGAPGFSARGQAKGLGAVKEVRPGPDRVEVVCANGAVRVGMAGDGSLHVVATDDAEFSRFPSFAVLPEVRERAVEVKEEPERLVLSAGLLTLIIDRKDSRMTVLDQSGAEIIAEPDGGGAFFDGDTVGCVKAMPADEHYYGFGEKMGPLDRRGRKMIMWNTDNGWSPKNDSLYQSHPYYLALRQGRAYGLFFDNTFRSVFDVGAATPDLLSFCAAGGELDYWVLAGPAPKDVLTRYGALVGTAPLPPKWALGYHQCRYSYQDEKKVREIRDGFIENKIPVDAIWLDIHYMNGYRVFSFDPKRFPDPAGLIAELKKDGIHTVVIVDPGVKVDPGYAPYDEGIAKDYFVHGLDAKPFRAQVWPGDANFPDFYRPEVRQWWGGLHKFYTDLGIAGIWNDMNEPAGWDNYLKIAGIPLASRPVPWLDMRHGAAPDLVPHARIHNVYALLEAEATYSGLMQLKPDARPFVLTRAGYPGIVRHTATWTGDNHATWDNLRTGLTMLLNMGMSGMAFVGNDIGGFGGGPSPELYARWIEQGVFYPFCRTHTAYGTPPQEPWSYGPEVTAISRDAIALRYELMPYIYSLFEESTRTNWPIIRPMVFEFPDDDKVTNMSDQFMLGPSLLVAPVVEKGAVKRTVYLPIGTWYDFYTIAKFHGPQEIEVDAPLSKTPMFVRAGGIIPVEIDLKRYHEDPWAGIKIKVYPGPEEMSFTLYEDDGSSFGYQKGLFAKTEIVGKPDPKGYEVSIKPHKGGFKSPVPHYLFIIDCNECGVIGESFGRAYDGVGIDSSHNACIFHVTEGETWLVEPNHD